MDSELDDGISAMINILVHARPDQPQVEWGILIHINMKITVKEGEGTHLCRKLRFHQLQAHPFIRKLHTFQLIILESSKKSQVRFMVHHMLIDSLQDCIKVCISERCLVKQ